MAMQFALKQMIYFCADMEAMTAFYAGVMGLKVIENDAFSLEEWVELDGGAFKLCLHKAGKPGASERSRNKLVFEVPDVGKAREYLIAHGVAMGVHHHWEGCDASDGRDPEGNAFQIAGPPTKVNAKG
jgi:catechol 2,3-dioxygenase-like lactoylglutathione lyase family enzyme